MSSFFFNDTATTEIYTLSLHDALPICLALAGVQCIEPVAAGLGNGDTDVHHTKNGDGRLRQGQAGRRGEECAHRESQNARDRKSTRLNSSHANISYAVFCLQRQKSETC